MRRHHPFALALLTLVACLDGNRSTGPTFAISDATHGGEADRNAFFFWLPPLVPAPSPTGDFNRFASPVVTVCELVADGSACATNGGQPIIVAQFSMTSGTGSEVIRVVPTDEMYIVNWHTDLSNLDPTKVYRITVSVDGSDYGFADVEVGEQPGELKNVDRDQFVPLLDGRTLPIKFRIEAGATCAELDLECAEAIVDPAIRETVTVFSGAVPLAFGDFPAGWTDEPQLVRITRIDDAAFSPGEGPLGTAFPQYPLFFQYETTAPEPFRLPVRIGVCNVEDPSDEPYHPADRPTTVLAMGGTRAEFRVLDRATTADILGTCAGAKRNVTRIGAGTVHPGELLAKIGWAAASLLAPQALEASALVLDGGMGGSTEAFTPAGTVDTASVRPDLVVSTGTPTVTPTVVAPGGTVQLSPWTNFNQGDANAPRGVSNGFYLSTDPTITSSDIRLGGNSNTAGVLAAGQGFDWGGPTPAIPVTTVPGNYYIGILVDEANALAESDETNNYVSTPLTVAITGAGSASVDGALSPDEWANAGCINFSAALPAGGTTPATFCVMNDESTLYAMLSFVRTSDPQSLAGVEFDIDGDGLLGTDPGDDLILIQQPPAGGFFRDEHVFTGGTCPVNAVCTTEDTQAEGTTDGSGAFRNDATRSVYEFAHPLASADAHDVALVGGATVKLQAVLSIHDALDGAAGFTRLPAGSAGLTLLVQTIVR